MTDSSSSKQTASAGSLRKPLIFGALPVIVCVPYWWLLHDVLPASAASPQIGVEHMRVHYGVFWALTYFPFTFICFLSALVMLIRRVRFSLAARWLLVPAGFVTAGNLVLLILMLMGY